jgi:hypothetical protein
MVSSSYETPEWILYETNTKFTLTPSSPLCVQRSLTIDKLTLLASEHGKLLEDFYA